MLRKRTQSTRKNQQMDHLATSDTGSDSYSQSEYLRHSHKTSSFLGVPGLFVGMNPKGPSDCDSTRSPTSPLDFRMFSSLGNPNRSPSMPRNRHQKSWDCSKVGLSIVDSLDEDVKGSGKVLRSSESKNILFGSRVRIKTPNFQAHASSFEAPKSLPRNFAIFPFNHIKSFPEKRNSDVLFEIGEPPFECEPFGKIRSCSLDSCRSFSSLSGLSDRNSKVGSGNSRLDNVTTQLNCPPQQFAGGPYSNNFSNTNLTSTPMSVGSADGFTGAPCASEIELSEDYTCVIAHGPNPKKIHIYGDYIFECHSDLNNVGKDEAKGIGLPQVASSSVIPTPFPSDDFLSFCYYCNKKLGDGKDIYIYRGEKAFCSLSCRSQEIMIDEALEKTYDKSLEDASKLDDDEELLQTGIMMIDAP